LNRLKFEENEDFTWLQKKGTTQGRWLTFASTFWFTKTEEVIFASVLYFWNDFVKGYLLLFLL
jgi:hypothetical protein